MEIKATLNKPYTEQERLHFIVTNNHQKGYEIRKTELALEAWGYTVEEILEQQRQTKIQEINQKIAELEAESVYDMLYNNSANVQIYKDIIGGLEKTRESLEIE